MIKELSFDKFRQNLARVRAFKGLSAAEIADRANLRQKKRCADIEEGRGRPTIEEIAVICDVLHVGIDEMLYRTPRITFEPIKFEPLI